ncbi:MAG: serine/threonine protein kinase, partial [Planctomycetales bacterium]|nr:serine/threonine protein kinase [Planctomycetales bacterium]
MATAKEIFLQAIEIESDDERKRYVDEACGSNLELRTQVVKLLEQHFEPDSRFSKPAARFAYTVTADGPNGGSGLSDSSSHHGRFLPGTKLADRYRIVSLLGRGGMGEVYRADDLRLGQTVALKFLPPELAKDTKRLEYFHREVRLARQISHPNICRVYDIGEVDGQHFISMEYIDGEDLKTLLHRIGRLPKDKGNQIAQQLCSGLSAAHAKGVLHRDLKPANIMIDGQGQARITDFGLATVSSDGESVIGMSGTPAYMAPEQLLRGETSVQSDVYSLGLILFEMFVGKPAHKADTLAELRKTHEQSSGSPQRSDFDDEIDPVVARAITRCLDSDILNRPSSANEIAASLPGGDPLAAMVAAGETPTPELIAAASDLVALSPRQAALLFLGVVSLLVVLFVVADRVYLVNRLKFPRTPVVLADRASAMLRRWGYDKPNDVAYGIEAISHEVEQSESTSLRGDQRPDRWSNFD